MTPERSDSVGAVLVYVVSSVNHGEQEGVVAVFSERERAETFAVSAKRSLGSNYYVTTWELDHEDWRPPEWR